MRAIKALMYHQAFNFFMFDLMLEIIYKCIFVVVIGVDAYVVLSIEKVLIVLFFIMLIYKFPTKSSLEIHYNAIYHRTHHSTLHSEHDSNYRIIFLL
jgi:hypothetical protein